MHEVPDTQMAASPRTDRIESLYSQIETSTANYNACLVTNGDHITKAMSEALLNGIAAACQ